MTSTWQTITLPSTLASGANFTGDVMLLLTDGSVFIHNRGNNGGTQWLRINPDPQQGYYKGGDWSSSYIESNMAHGREYFASGVLMDGRVFAIGGEYLDGSGSDSPLGEIYDPQINEWSPINKLPTFNFISGDCNGSVLSDGRVLLGGTTKRTAIWDPNDNSWIEAGLQFGNLSATDKDDSADEESCALLQDGSVLFPEVQNTPKAQRYVPSLDDWINCSPSQTNFPNLALTTMPPQGANPSVNVDEIGPAVLLPSGNVFVIGGTGQTAVFTPPGPTTPQGSWTVGPALPTDTSTGAVWGTLTALDAPACLLPNGKVVLMGGTTTFFPGSQPDYFSKNPVFFEYDPNANPQPTTMPQLDVQPNPPLPAGTWTYECFFLLLPTGQLLLSNNNSNTLLLYTPDSSSGSPDPSWKPANISIQDGATPTITVITGHSYTLQGTQINGLSQAVYYGDDNGMATNYPIVTLTNPGNNDVYYLRSYNFSTMGVAPGTSIQSCMIDIPSDLPLPPNTSVVWSLAVIANGISSNPISVQIATQGCFLIVDDSTFGKAQIDSFVNATSPVPAVFNPAFYVVVEGYTQTEIGTNLPQVPSPYPGHLLIAASGPMIPEDPSLPANRPQRFTFPFSMTFMDDSMFPTGTSAVNATITATFNVPGILPVTNSATITLTPNPNPYILHGDQTGTPPEPWYLSQDLKVFQVAESQSKFGAPPIGVLTGGATPESVSTAFIQAAVNQLRSGNYVNDFNTMAQDEGAETLQLLPNDPTINKPVYNFAIARIRLRGVSVATNVRVFFRIWQAQQTNATYSNTTYARMTNTESPPPIGLGPQPIPVLGVQGDEIITIPFFATPRVSTNQQLHTQTDDFNIQTITGGSGETDTFFGCWLDINQPADLRYPQRIVNVSPDGPFNSISPLFPIQQFMAAAHQCLIAEIAFDSDPIPPQADPSNSDKLAQRNLAFLPVNWDGLAQRNLAFVEAPNPGNPESRLVPQTFEVRPTLTQLPKGMNPDELMIVWESLPDGSVAEVYFPAISADTILQMANNLYTSHLLQMVDAHTIRSPATGVTYIPIPQGEGVTFAGLVTVYLPSGIQNGDSFAAIIKQITSVARSNGNIKNNDNSTVTEQSDIRQWRRTSGTFRLTIPVSAKTHLLKREEQYLSLMKWNNESIPKTSRWHDVMQRYITQVASRVSSMGGDPTTIPPTDSGIWFVGIIVEPLFDPEDRFRGFVLETVDRGIKRFESRDRNVERTVIRALNEHHRVVVMVDVHHLDHATSVQLM